MTEPGLNIPLATWLTCWRAMQRYHRYRVEGLHKLVDGGAKLMVAYHGRPIAHDQCMLSVSLYDALGYMPHGIVHAAARTNPLMNWVTDGLGFVTGDGPDLAAAVERGELIAVQPGGIREGCRPHSERYRVDWGRRTGFVRMALRYRLPVVPIAAAGVDDCYIGLNDGYRWGKRLRVPAGLPAWLGVGALGLWPLSPPFPVRITSFIGDPIDLEDQGPIDPNDEVAVLAAQRRVAHAVQALLPR